jgi:hypothetical protein
MPKATEKQYVQLIRDNRSSGEPVELALSTDERVLARISDGIYRQPASALRELIANAYDADATKVIIKTDYPRFDTISVRDNGMGMDEATLVHLIHHIGGSAKRQFRGAELGIVDSKDLSRAPSGRKLIGKIGIGLFSVSQMTHTFKIVTKKRGADYRLIADVTLRTYSEDEAAEEKSGKKTDRQIETGRVRITSVPARDLKGQGTEIILSQLLPSARDTLQSQEIWEKYEESDEAAQEAFQAPDWHIGRIAKDGSVTDSRLPWTRKDPPDVRFQKLVDAIEESNQTTGPKPSLENTFDRYLQSVWNLSLAAPLEYIEGVHPFDLEGDKYTKYYILANDKETKTATEIKVKRNQTVRDACATHGMNLSAPEDRGVFNVFFDDIKLARPIKFRYPSGFDKDNVKTHPVMYIGKCAPPVQNLGSHLSGGSRLEFEAYFLWSQVVLPQEHIGTMVRIADNSGTLFERTFYEYKVQEVIRMRQLSSEIYMLHGLDAALNIDRESLNYGHTHTKILVGWIHRAMRQITNAQKKAASSIHRDLRIQALSTEEKRLRAIVDQAYKEEGAGPALDVELVSDPKDLPGARKKATLVINATEVLPRDAFSPTKGKAERRTAYEEQVKALTQLLEAYGLLSQLSWKKQEKLIRGIMKIFHEGQKT